jgi:hypothetical protein
MNPPPDIPVEKARTLGEIADRLRVVPNVIAIVLGGSYASGLAQRDSDIDVGIYYRETTPFSIDHMRSVAESICTPGSVPTVTEMYGWGPWVNGGAWIQTPTGKVDFLYRNLDQVQRVIEEGCRGILDHDYDQQPPYGFRSVVYFGETHICLPIHDPDGEIARLKQSVADYPEAMRERMIQNSLWGVEFSLLFCRRFAGAADVYNAAGCMSRVAQYLVHTLFALNKEYFVSDKYAKRLLDRFALQPREFMTRLERVLSNPGNDSVELSRSVELLTALWLETVQLTAGTYKSRFQL